MKHFSHEHSLILNEVYIAKEGDVCRGCNKEIVSCRSFVYSCSNSNSSSASSTSTNTSDVNEECDIFLLHRSCAELPPTIKNPNDDNLSLYLYFNEVDCEDFDDPVKCTMCGTEITWNGFIYISSGSGNHTPTTVYVCSRCAMSSLKDVRIYDEHPAHPQHALKYVEYLSSFTCSACKVDDNIKDLSYICTKCRYWVIHKSCADAPASFQFQFHDKHPLKLSLSLPEVYRVFAQYCRFCRKELRHIDWLYYCPKCRFFVHFHCARSNQMKSFRLDEDEIYDSDVVHLPAADESSADQLAEEFVKEMSTLIHSNTIYSATNRLKHWAHDKHVLKLMTNNELNDQKHEKKLLCDGCVKPIRTDHHDYDFYGCIPCNYFMHKVCAEFPREIEHHLMPGITLYADMYSRSILHNFRCNGCGVLTNGIAFRHVKEFSGNVHIGCLTLPKKIKHEAHIHQLNQVCTEEHVCKACGDLFSSRYKYWCEKCGYDICAKCVMKPRTVKHRWDTHPLSLIYDPGMVSSDHEHDFECEYCSNVIDTNFWFYHCSDCDLSFHLRNCFEDSSFREYSNIKFGAVVYPRRRGLHHHSLTYVLNKKFRTCERCQNSSLLGQPVLECAPCKVIFCILCWSKIG